MKIGGSSSLARFNGQRMIVDFRPAYRFLVLVNCNQLVNDPCFQVVSAPIHVICIQHVRESPVFMAVHDSPIPRRGVWCIKIQEMDKKVDMHNFVRLGDFRSEVDRSRFADAPKYFVPGNFNGAKPFPRRICDYKNQRRRRIGKNRERRKSGSDSYTLCAGLSRGWRQAAEHRRRTRERGRWLGPCEGYGMGGCAYFYGSWLICRLCWRGRNPRQRAG